MKRCDATAHNARIKSKPKFHEHLKEDKITSYCKAFKYLRETHATIDIIGETDDYLMPFTQLSNKLPKEYAGVFWKKVRRCDIVYNRYVSKGMFLKVCGNWTPIIRVILRLKMNAIVHDRVRPTSSLSESQHGLRYTNACRHNGKSNNRLGKTGDRKKKVYNMNWISL